MARHTSQSGRSVHLASGWSDLFHQEKRILQVQKLANANHRRSTTDCEAVVCPLLSIRGVANEKCDVILITKIQEEEHQEDRRWIAMIVKQSKFCNRKHREK